MFRSSPVTRVKKKKKKSRVTHNLVQEFGSIFFVSFFFFFPPSRLWRSILLVTYYVLHGSLCLLSLSNKWRRTQSTTRRDWGCWCSCAFYSFGGSFCFFNHLLSTFLDAVKGRTLEIAPTSISCRLQGRASSFTFGVRRGSPRRRAPDKEREGGGFPLFYFIFLIFSFRWQLHFVSSILWLVYKGLKRRLEPPDVFIRWPSLWAAFSNKNGIDGMPARLEFPLLSFRSVSNFRFGLNPRNSMNVVGGPQRLSL